MQLSTPAVDKLSHGLFKDVLVTRPNGTPQQFVMVLSGAGARDTPGELTTAFSTYGAMVVSVDVQQFFKALGAESDDCISPSGPLENLSRHIQAQYKLNTYLTPILAGRGQGATLAYSVLAQGPDGVFGGAVSMGFCPTLRLAKPMCKSGLFDQVRDADGQTMDLRPAARLSAPWVTIQAEGDGACNAAAARVFIASVAKADLTTVAGVGGTQAFDASQAAQAAALAAAQAGATVQANAAVSSGNGGTAVAGGVAKQNVGNGGNAARTSGLPNNATTTTTTTTTATVTAPPATTASASNRQATPTTAIARATVIPTLTPAQLAAASAEATRLAAAPLVPPSAYLPALRSAYFKLGRDQTPLPPPPASLADLPIIEAPSKLPGNTFAVFLSGDGGWAGIDKEVAAALNAQGVSVAGFDSLRYFWTKRTPESLATDLDRVIRFYASRWNRSEVLLIGYSQGADVLPFALTHLPPATKALVRHTTLMGLGQKASFEFHVTNWIGPSGDRPIAPEGRKLEAANTLCIYSPEEKDSLCPTLAPVHVRAVSLAGGHHFNGDYEKLAKVILDDAKR
ncbi:MAG: type secretion system protein VirJ [Rhizobacter sp.]|nr:type secretion system protein VirJ [Rhizobacter sp.]